MGNNNGSVTIKIVGHQRQGRFLGGASEDFLPGLCGEHSGIFCGIIGTSDGPEFCRHVPKGSAALPIRPRLLVYGTIARVYGRLCWRWITVGNAASRQMSSEFRLETGRLQIASVSNFDAAISHKRNEHRPALEGDISRAPWSSQGERWCVRQWGCV